MRRASYAFWLAALACYLPAQADDSPVFRSDVALVRVDAQVVDRDNRAITGLGPRDFLLIENGKPQTIQSVDSENQPVDLVLLLDVSASMRPHIERIASASREAMRQLREEDRVAILVFDRQMRVRMGFRSSQSGIGRELERLLDQETFRGGTDITGGLLDAADYVRREGRAEARKAIVIVTDDQTERNRDVEGVSHALTRADAVLCALIAPDAMRYRGGGYPGGGYPGGSLGGIIFGQPGGRRGYPGQTTSPTQSAETAEIARESGGDSMRMDDAYALQDTLARIRQRYALYFGLPPGVRAGEQRQIELELTATTRSRYLGSDVRYRRQYYAPDRVVATTQPGTDARPGTAGPADDPDRPYLRRRAVSPGSDSTREGPLDIGGTPRTAAPATAAPASAPPAPNQASPAPAADPNAPGWRKARPDELPQQKP